jgi:MoaA/NifB/PqqE/SkfB family radical SAM enzyme
MPVLQSTVKKKVYARFPSFTHPFLDELFAGKKYLGEKLSNFRLNLVESRLKKSRLLSYPSYLVIDPTNICSLTCPLCPTWQDTGARPKGKMNPALFRSIMDEAGPYVFALNLCNWGEPLFNPALPDMISYAKGYNIVIGLSTNLNYLPDDTARELVASGLDIMVVSLDGATQESYSTYRRGGNFSTVMSNIEKMNSYRENSKKFPLLIWQFLVNKYNESEIPAAREMAEKMNMLFLPGPMRTSMGKELLLPLYERVKEMRDWLPENPSYKKYPSEITPETKTRQTTCQWLWDSTVVNWDGSLSPCCGVFEKSWDFDTCYNEKTGGKLTLHQAWNSPLYILARKLVAASMKKSPGLASLVRQADQENLICRNCIRFGFLEE